MIQEGGLVETLLSNLSEYCRQAASKVKDDTDVSQRKKLFLVNAKYSHSDEIDERLQFIKYIASISNEYQVSKAELNTLYSLLVIESKIPSDYEEFLIWCKSSCE